jgi:hypothetical protein
VRDTKPLLLALTPYGSGGASARVRVHAWAQRFSGRVQISQYLGHHNSSFSWLASRPTQVLRAERSLRQLDVRGMPVLLHREVSPFSRGAIEARMLRSAQASCFDVDDAVFLDFGDGSWYRSVFPKAPKAALCARLADRVIAGNEFLADWASGYAKEVVVIPSCVDPGEYVQKTDFELHDPPVVGWLGSPSTEPELWSIREALLEVHRRTGSIVEVVSRGAEVPPALRPIVKRLNWSRESVGALSSRWDLGIMPLRDDLWQRGKCGYKLLQYGGMHLPAVASPVGVNRAILGQADLPAPRSISEWVDALCHVITSSAATRAAMAERLSAVVRDQYTYDSWAQTWIDTVTDGVA